MVLGLCIIFIAGTMVESGSYANIFLVLIIGMSVFFADYLNPERNE